MGDLQPRLDDVTDGVADLDAIAHLERTAIGHHVAGDDVGDRRRRPEREDDAEEQRDALERGAAGAWNVGIGDNERKRHDRDAHDLIGRLRPVGFEIGEPDGALAHRLEEEAEESQHHTNDEEQHNQEDQARDVIDNPAAHHLQRSQREAEHVL